jgi:hypothetical protein
VSEVISAYSTLASAISYVESVESTQPALAQYQSTIQTLEVSYSTILTDLYLYTGIEYPTLYSASLVISAATLTDSSIFASVLAVSTAVSSSPTVSSAVDYLSYAAYTLPETVVEEIVTYISSPSTVGASTVSSLESCYSTVISELAYVTAFTYYYPSIVTDLTAYISAASYVSSLGSAVYTIVSYQMPTFSYEVSVLTAAVSTLPSLSTDLAVLTVIEAESPTVYYAESTIEASFYASPTVAYSIYYALNYPSLVSSPTTIAYEEESHESLVTAISYVIDWTDYYTSSAPLLTGVESGLISAFESYRTLLTAYSYVQDITSPSLASASVSISAAKSVVSSLTTVLSAINYLDSEYPAVACAEADLEYYATEYPSVVTYLWSVYDGVSYVASSSASSFESFANQYTTIGWEMHLISQYWTSSNDLMFACEPSFLFAAESDSSLLTQYQYMDYASESASLSYEYYASAVSSSSYY